jgi:hypothetical protein
VSGACPFLRPIASTDHGVHARDAQPIARRCGVVGSGRTNLGSDIFVHGKAISVGCLAMGDEAIEELFVLTSDVGRENVRVVIAPSDPRTHELSVPSSPVWVADLYQLSRPSTGGMYAGNRIPLRFEEGLAFL